jgi:hypothetical protein
VPEEEGVFLCRDEFEAGFFVQINNTGGPVDVWAVTGSREPGSEPTWRHRSPGACRMGLGAGGRGVYLARSALLIDLFNLTILRSWTNWRRNSW